MVRKLTFKGSHYVGGNLLYEITATALEILSCGAKEGTIWFYKRPMKGAIKLVKQQCFETFFDVYSEQGNRQIRICLDQQGIYDLPETFYVRIKPKKS